MQVNWVHNVLINFRKLLCTLERANTVQIYSDQRVHGFPKIRRSDPPVVFKKVKDALKRWRNSGELCSLTIFVHLYVKALLQPTGLTLIAPRHINRAVASFLALVRQIAANASLEESTTTVAREHTVMFPGRSVSADSAQNNRFAIYS